VVDDLSSAYSKRMVQATWDAPRTSLSDAFGVSSSPHVIYIAIDPSGGGASKFSLVSLSLYQLGTRLGSTIQSMSKRPRVALPDGTANTGRDHQEPVGFLVHGMENEPILNRDQAYPWPQPLVPTLTPPQIWATVIGHIRNLRKKHPPGDCLLVLGVCRSEPLLTDKTNTFHQVENNLGNEASHIAHMCRVTLTLPHVYQPPVCLSSVSLSLSFSSHEALIHLTLTLTVKG